MSNLNSLCIGLTETHQCGYLTEENERLAVILEPELHTTMGYEALIQSGFRRSADTLYRPHCPNCNACQSLRIDVMNFTPSKSQKRQLKQLQQLDFELKEELDANWFDLYDQYISKRHANGSMYPAQKERFLNFIQSSWLKVKYLHIYQNNQLIAVAAIDTLLTGWSAIYTFFAPDHPWSLGSICILAQLELAKKHNIIWLYLGYQIDACSVMNYKKKYQPHQRFHDETWHDQQ